MLRHALKLFGKRVVAKQQFKVWAIAADHGRRVFYQYPVTLLALAHLLGRLGRFAHVQPQADGLDRLAQVVTQQAGFVQYPVVAAKVVAQAVAAAGLAVAQQRAGALQPQLAVVGVQRLAWLAGLFAVRLPAQQWRQAGAEEFTVQRAFGIALDVNHGG
ncbi:hypothetical protein D3C76_957910 [compost metagenome]